MSSPIINHFFVSLFAVVHAGEYAPISWHRAQAAFIRKGATADRRIMVMCPLGRMSMERSRGGIDFCLKVARCRSRVPVDVARCGQAANEMALKGVDMFFLDQRISLAVVTVGGEEGEINILARSGVWRKEFCAPRIFVKAT